MNPFSLFFFFAPATFSMLSKESTKISEADEKILDVENRFLYLTANKQQEAEILDARLSKDGTRYTSLKERIDSIEGSPSVIYETIEG